MRTALQRAMTAAREARSAAGCWQGRVASSPLATAVALAALAGDDRPGVDLEAAAAYLRRTQNPDGGWGDTEIGKSNLAATLLVLSAHQSSIVNRQSSILPDSDLHRANAFIAQLGGLDAGLKRVYGADQTFQVPIRMTAAYAGRGAEGCGLSNKRQSSSATQSSVLSPQSWRHVDALPFELALVPRGLMGAAGLPVVSYALPALVCVGLARHANAPSRFPPLRWLRNFAAERALSLVSGMQPKSGGFLEAVPITAFCLIGLKSAGRGVHGIAKQARRFLQSTQREDGAWPVEVHLATWNTTRAIDALQAAGLLEEALDARERAATREWLFACQNLKPHPYTGTAPGGWGWNELDGAAPDADDTAGALLALRHLGVPAEDTRLQAGLRWLVSLQNRDGGIPTFCRGWQKLPFDRSAPDLTAHALRAMQALGATGHPAYAKAWAYLERVQRADGSFAPLWFGCEDAADELNATYGTCQVLYACEAEPRAAALRGRALAWLRSIRNPDGGFGGALGARSTAEETGLALRALAACSSEDDPLASGAARWLAERQRADGSWNPAPIGFYFAVLWYHEALYPLCHALGGLGAWARRRGPAERAVAREPALPAQRGS
ncbi:MAG: squalene--hopene cyclase [Planctomycetota bacterium]|nr:squalene--hopene cyclase [Planctomycetota bacterium]